MNWKLLCLMFLAWINVVGIALPYPVLSPLLIHNDFPTLWNLSPMMTVMVILALYPFGQFLGSPIIGAYSDRWGPRRIVTVSMAFTALGYLFSAYCIAIKHVEGLALFRFLTGIAEGNFGVLRAEVARISQNPKERIKFFGLFHAAATMGWVIGPVLGSLLWQPTLNPLLNASTPFVFGGILGIIGVVLGCLAIGKRKGLIEKKKPILKTLSELWQMPNLAVLLIMSFLITLAIDGFYEFYPAFLSVDFEADSAAIALNTVCLTSTMIVSQIFLIPHLSPRFFSFLIPSLLVASSMVGMASFTNTFALSLCFSLCGLGIGVLTTLVPATVSERTPESHQGAVMGTMASLRSFGDAFVCLSFGVLGDWSIYLPFMLIGIVIISASERFGRMTEKQSLKTSSLSL